MKALSRESAKLFEDVGVEESVAELFAANEDMLEPGAFFVECPKQATEFVL